ncbi:hypothetical protein H0H93_000427, partial [Arthromyces matolae]
MSPSNESKYYKRAAPALGHATRDECFAFAPGYINLNCGSFGATPVSVTEEVARITQEIEANPDLFHRLDYVDPLNEARALMADYIGADINEVVLVANASTGVNTVLRNFEWEQGDTIVS